MIELATTGKRKESSFSRRDMSEKEVRRGGVGSNRDVCNGLGEVVETVKYI